MAGTIVAGRTSWPLCSKTSRCVQLRVNGGGRADDATPGLPPFIGEGERLPPFGPEVAEGAPTSSMFAWLGGRMQ